jgi:uncharacterized protein (DUF427 family)
MSQQTVLVPGPDHPIAIERNPRRVVVTLNGEVVADTTEALTLREARYPAVQYIPRKDVKAALERSSTLSRCPYKGQASYFSVSASGSRSADAAWSYETPHEAVEAIREHLAFYPDRVSSIEERDA